MNIICPHCNKEVPIEDAFKHQITEQALGIERKKFEADLIKAKDEASKNASKELELQLVNLQKEKEEEKERNTKLTKQLNDLLEEIRIMRRKDEEREIEFKKKIMEEETKIRDEASKKVEEDHRLKDLEKDKKISDALKKVEEMKTKMQQGSMQTQGEVLELELEQLLKTEFPTDSVSEVGKGVRGGDITQEVIDRNGQQCGSILWESKNAQWSEKWLEKLRDDQRNMKAEIAVLVSVNLPQNITNFLYREGVWICSRKLAISLAYSLRYNLIQAQYIRKSQDGKKEKSDIVYNYLCSVEFRHRVEALIENYDQLQKELESEKRWFALKWARQEKSLRQLTDQTHGFYGDLQGIIGSGNLPELSAGENGNED